MVDELNRQDLNLVKLFESWNVYVATFCYVEEDSVDEEEECLYVQELTPWETQVEEKLGEALEINAHLVELLLLLDFGLSFFG